MSAKDELRFGRYAAIRRPQNAADIEAFARSEAGARASTRHADRKIFGWSDSALVIVRRFCRARTGMQMIAEEIIAHAHNVCKLPLPPDPRAWGSVIRRAKRDGLIRKVGYRTAGTANASPKPLWEVA